MTPLEAAEAATLIAGLHPMQLVHCQFVLREPVTGGFRYTRISVAGPGGQGYLITPIPPQAGDLISLHDHVTGRHHLLRVYGRMWLHSSWGSMHWPILKRLPDHPPLLEIFGDEAEGLYADQITDPEDQ